MTMRRSFIAAAITAATLTVSMQASAQTVPMASVATTVG